MPGGSDAVSNPGTNESFDALIDLLGSDDVVQDPRFGNPSNHGLRDDDGKLHLGKIHTFFSGGQDDGEHHAVPVPSGDDLEEQSEIDHSSPEGDKSPVQRSSPASPQNIAGDNIRNNHPLDTQILIDLESDLLSPLVAPVIEPTDVEALTRALRLANAEVANLRRQCDNLRSLVHGHDSNSDSPPDSPVLRPIFNHSPNSSVSSLDEPRPISSNFTPITPSEVAELTEDQAKRALASILRRLSLPPSCLLDETNSESTIASHRPANIAEVQRALNFVLRTDELVWRRSVYGSVRGGPSAAVFDAPNIESLNDRLALWERVVRRSRL